MKRILFVDDEKNILDGIRRSLHAQRDRWEMHFALSGEDALALCEQLSFDVVVTDMRMPGMDGATLLGHIRDRFPEAARLILSGYSETALAGRAAAVAYRVLTKPCNGAELQEAIERVCTLQDIFCTPQIRKTIGSIGQLPSLSSTYSTLTLAVADPEVSIASIAGIIEGDVAMTAKVLQLVNSGFFGLAKPMTTVSNAVNYLGLETIKNLVLVSDTFRVFTAGSGIPLSFCQTLQRHANRTARIVATLPLERNLRDIAVVAALLQDAGELILACRMPEQFAAALHLARKTGCRSFEAEEATFGTSHAEIGACLLGLWGLNPLTVEAVAHHHRPTRVPHTGLDASTAVYIAGRLAVELDSPPSDLHGGVLPEPDIESISRLGLLPQLPSLLARAIAALP